MSTLQTTARRELILTTIKELEDRKHFPEGRLIVDGVSRTPDGLRSFLAISADGFLDDIERQLSEALTTSQRRMDYDARWRAEDEARSRQAVPADGNDPGYREELRKADEIRAISEYQRSTPGRLESIENVLIEIRDALKLSTR